MFTVIKWILKDGIRSASELLTGFIGGALIGSFIALVVGSQIIFYLPLLLVSLGLSKFWAAFVFGGVIGAFIMNVLMAVWPRQFSDFKYPIVPMSGMLGMIVGEAAAFFFVLGRADRLLAAGFALGFLIALGIIMDIWLAVKGIKSGLPEE